jgi:glutaconyl-CoA/methylmalonyl-CoA decarboxylase subunit delta
MMNWSIFLLSTGQIQNSQLLKNNIGNSSIWILISIVLILAFLFFYFLYKTDKTVAEREKNEVHQTNQQSNLHNEPTEEVSVAIALALSMYKIQLSEMENLSLTIQKVSKMYSPWSSKIYSLRQLPR